MGRKPRNGGEPKIEVEQTVFTINEGEVTVGYPWPLNAASIADLKAELDLFVGRLTRRAETEAAEAQAKTKEAHGSGDDE